MQKLLSLLPEVVAGLKEADHQVAQMLFRNLQRTLRKAMSAEVATCARSWMLLSPAQLLSVPLADIPGTN